MSLILLIVAVVLFLIAGIILAAGGSLGIGPLALIAFGLASFAASFAVGAIPRP